MNSNKSRRINWKLAVAIQACSAVALVSGWLLLPPNAQRRILADANNVRPTADVVISNLTPAVVRPLYDDASVVSDEDLAAVIEKVLPRFSRRKLRPNYVEHALRIWGSEIEFDDPDLISGPQMVDYLLDSAAYVDSWGKDSSPILEPTDAGVHIRWGKDGSASVHHDHLLASLAEAGVSLDRPVFTAARRTTLQQVFSEALRDFRLDERETEWSVMAFSLYLSPQQTSAWHNSQGRHITFDMLAERLMRQCRNQGVCLGTHRVYSLMALLRLNDEFGGHLVSDNTTADVTAFLEYTRDLIIASQDKDGSWPPNWYDGIHAADRLDPNEKLYRRVIATGHQLEWLAIAPQELHPPHDQIVAAARWVVQNTLTTTQDVIDANFTYYSHVANALALWRGTSVPEFWEKTSPKSSLNKTPIPEITGNSENNP